LNPWTLEYSPFWRQGVVAVLAIGGDSKEEADSGLPLCLRKRFLPVLPPP
ncbi:Hypothetical protein FKW44_000846, partial [Caligus rogercresseyi]